MPDPRTTPQEHDKPVFQPTTPPTGPTPEDPRQREPIHDPPIQPEQDDPMEREPRQAEDGSKILFDEDRKPG
jgi:hypothetical protein